MPPDYYARLRVAPGADPAAIAAAYRRLALRYHPDRNPRPDATATMARINEAYEVLSDPRRRAAYDATRRTPADELPAAPPDPGPLAPEPASPVPRSPDPAVAVAGVVGLVVVAGPVVLAWLVDGIGCGRLVPAVGTASAAVFVARNRRAVPSLDGPRSVWEPVGVRVAAAAVGAGVVGLCAGWWMWGVGAGVAALARLAYEDHARRPGELPAGRVYVVAGLAVLTGFVLGPRARWYAAVRGADQVRQNDLGGAIREFTAAVEYAPRDPAGYYLRGVAGEAAGNASAALADYADAVRLDPRHVDALVRRGGLLARTGDHARAVDDWDRAAALGLTAAQEESVLAARARSHDALGRHQDARTDRANLARRNPASPGLVPVVRTHFRPSLIGRGQVLVVTNPGPAALGPLGLRVNQGVEHAVTAGDLAPNQSVEAGWLELGTGLATGDRVAVTVRGVVAFTVVVP